MLLVCSEDFENKGRVYICYVTHSDIIFERNAILSDKMFLVQRLFFKSIWLVCRFKIRTGYTHFKLWKKNSGY